jgi:hypothetical protein
VPAMLICPVFQSAESVYGILRFGSSFLNGYGHIFILLIKTFPSSVTALRCFKRSNAGSHTHRGLSCYISALTFTCLRNCCADSVLT